MDEPFLGKDIFTRRDFLKLMIASMEEDEAVMIATHLIDEIENVLTRAVILKDGRVKEDISMEKLRESGNTLLDVMKSVCGYREDRVLNMLEDD
jgi:ABC-2 type transport system ATP-binding protein